MYVFKDLPIYDTRRDVRDPDSTVQVSVASEDALALIRANLPLFKTTTTARRGGGSALYAATASKEVFEKGLFAALEDPDVARTLVWRLSVEGAESAKDALGANAWRVLAVLTGTSKMEGVTIEDFDAARDTVRKDDRWFLPAAVVAKDPREAAVQTLERMRAVKL